MESAINIALCLIVIYVMYNAAKFLVVSALKKTDMWYQAKGQRMAREAIANDIPVSSIRLFARSNMNNMTDSQLKAFNDGVDQAITPDS